MYARNGPQRAAHGVYIRHSMYNAVVRQLTCRLVDQDLQAQESETDRENKMQRNQSFAYGDIFHLIPIIVQLSTFVTTP